MPAHPPPPGWTRRVKIHGWPIAHLGPAMKDQFSRKIAHDFWQKVARRIIYDLIHTGTAVIYPLGTLDKIPNSRAEFTNPRTRLPTPRTHEWHIRFRPSNRMRALLNSGAVPPAEQTSSTIKRAISDAQIAPLVGTQLWQLYAATITSLLSRGQHINLSGFGTFHRGISATHHYRDVHTHLLKTARGKITANFRPSKLMKGWIEAGAIPPDV